jgi:hypothetical protein
VADHKFRSGQKVKLATSSLNRSEAGGIYIVMKRLAERHGEVEYRIKSTSEPHERVARESDLGAPRDHHNYISRGDTRFCRAPLRRRYRVATRPRHLQSAEAHRPIRDDFAPGYVEFPTFAVFVWLCEAGPAQFPGAAQSAAQHGVGCGSGAQG